MAGPGRRLDSSDNSPAGSSKSTKSSSDAYVPPKRTELTSEARFGVSLFFFSFDLPRFPFFHCCFFFCMRRTAAEAALSRVQTQKKDDTQFNTSLAAIRAQVQRELEAEWKAKAELEKDQVASHEVQPKILDDQCNRNLAAQGVYFR